MENQDNYQERYTRARERVNEIRSFYSHLTIYLFVMGGLAALNYYQNEWNRIWFLWAAFGWGIGITAHGLNAFQVRNLFLGKDWEEKKIKEIMDRERKKR